MRTGAAALACAMLVMSAPALAQSAKPLFADDSVLQLTIQGPLSAISANREMLHGRPGTLTIAGEQLPITLAPRGLTRRSFEICDFPPLRVDFPAPPPDASPFAGQRRLKLVTHCRRSEAHQQYVLLEYAAYRMYNLLTPFSYRARLAKIDYRDSGGRSYQPRLGFFLEDIDDVAARNGLSRMPVEDRISVSTLSAREAALAAMFQYMIGNLDWSMRAGPQGQGCCHNFRLLRGNASPGTIPVPYDFDFAGLVDAPYATPPEAVPVTNVRVRVYRGYCMHNAQALAAAREIRSKQPELTAVIAGLPGIAPQTVRKAIGYLQPFFAQITDDRTAQQRILSRCIR